METDVNAAGDAKTTGSDWLMQEVYKLVKKLASVKIFDHGFMFNNTEIQMMKEIVRVKEEGGRIISSRLAKELGITRSAVSQMVNKLEKQNIVMRVPDERDKKIAYIELSSDANVVYEDIKGRISAVMSEILAKLGEEKVRGFLEFASEFVDVFEKAVEHFGNVAVPSVDGSLRLHEGVLCAAKEDK